MADNNSEILALLAEALRAADRDREENMRRFTQLTETMGNGFLRLEDKLGGRIDNVVTSVDHLTEEVKELKIDMREVKTDIREIKMQGQETNRRLSNAFDHVGELTEAADDNQLCLSHIEQAQQPTNAELDARLRAVKERLRNAS